MARNSAERRGGEYDLEPTGSTFSCTSQITPTSIYKCGIILVSDGVVYPRDLLYC